MSVRPADILADAAQAGWASVHASAIVVGESGVLIRGPSGSGKSGLTLALLDLAGQRRSFGRLIGDDRVLMRPAGRRILARGAPQIRGLVEMRGYGIVDAAVEPCAIIRLVVDLSPQEERGARLPDEQDLKVSVAGVALPRLAFDAGSVAIERAYAVLGRLDKIDDKIMTGRAHFA